MVWAFLECQLRTKPDTVDSQRVCVNCVGFVGWCVGCVGSKITQPVQISIQHIWARAQEEIPRPHGAIASPLSIHQWYSNSAWFISNFLSNFQSVSYFLPLSPFYQQNHQIINCRIFCPPKFHFNHITVYMKETLLLLLHFYFNQHKLCLHISICMCFDTSGLKYQLVYSVFLFKLVWIIYIFFEW